VIPIGADSAPLAEHTRAVQAVRALARVSRVLERASGEVNMAHYRVLSAVGSGDERASRVAERLALGKPTVSAAVHALSRRGLLSMIDSPGDRRAMSLSLTAEGKAVLERVEREMVAGLEELCAHVPDRERLLDSLGWLGAAIERKRTEPRGRVDGTEPRGRVDGTEPRRARERGR
jgi:DNA-binding MarR family transcriptional regulator